MAVSVPYGISIHWVGGAYLLMVECSAGGKIEDQKPETNYLDKIISCISNLKGYPTLDSSDWIGFGWYF